MNRIRRVSPVALLALLGVTGFAVSLIGLYLLAGLAVTMLAGGVCMVAAALLVDA